MYLPGSINLKKPAKIEYSETYITSTVKDDYWPMVLLCYMEFIYLVQLTNEACPDISLIDVKEEAVRELEDFRIKMLGFRLHFRYSQASYLEHHNDFFLRWRKTFGSEHLSHELIDDIQQINSLLAYLLEKDDILIQEKQNRRLTTLGIYATTIISATGLFGTNLKPYSNPDIEILSLTTFLTIGGALLVAAVANLIYWWLVKKRN